ncbi:UNVERIFIED_CONTAM: hypothetical protein NCL1_29590 [Trichonephila clavipes]
MQPETTGACHTPNFTVIKDDRMSKYLILFQKIAKQTLPIRFSRGRTPEGGQGPSPNFTRGLAARRLFKVPRCREGTIHLQTSMSSPGFEPSPNGIAVSVANTTIPVGRLC